MPSDTYTVTFPADAVASHEQDLQRLSDLIECLRLALLSAWHEYDSDQDDDDEQVDLGALYALALEVKRLHLKTVGR